MIKSWKKIKFFRSKIAIYSTHPQASLKDAQATGEAFSSQKRTSSTSKHEISLLFLFFGVIFALLDSDPATHINSDPCGSESKTLQLTYCTEAVHVQKFISRNSKNLPCTSLRCVYTQTQQGPCILFSIVFTRPPQATTSVFGS